MYFYLITLIIKFLSLLPEVCRNFKIGDSDKCEICLVSGIWSSSVFDWISNLSFVEWIILNKSSLLSINSSKLKNLSDIFFGSFGEQNFLSK